jgi:predicted nucleic acid-binding protein
MSDSDPCCVLDASVLIDLVAGDLLLEFQGLPFAVGIPDGIEQQEIIQEPAVTELSTLVYETIHFEARHYESVIRLRTKYTSTSIPDLLAFIAARERQDVLITGDHNFRRWAEDEGIEVHGVLDELVRLKSVGPLRAAQALKDMLTEGSCMPPKESERRFKKWGAPAAFWES